MRNERKIPLDLPPSEDPLAYDIGYRKPPSSGQFKPGRSGNPRGRPKGARNKRPALNEERLKGIILDEAYRTIKVTEGKRQISIPMAQAIVRALAVNAARGQLRSQQFFATLLSETERVNKASNDEYLETAIEYKRHWESELDRRKALGISGPEPLPHPDDIIVDMRTGQVTVKGPITREDKAEWDRFHNRVVESDRAIEETTAELKRCRKPSLRRVLEDEIAYERRMRQIIVNAIGEPTKR